MFKNISRFGTIVETKNFIFSTTLIVLKCYETIVKVSINFSRYIFPSPKEKTALSSAPRLSNVPMYVPRRTIRIIRTEPRPSEYVSVDRFYHTPPMCFVTFKTQACNFLAWSMQPTRNVFRADRASSYRRLEEKEAAAGERRKRAEMAWLGRGLWGRGRGWRYETAGHVRYRFGRVA